MEKKKNRVLSKIWNFIKKVFTGLLLLFLLAILIFLIPQVQTYLGKQLTQDFNETYQTDLKVDGLKINYKGNIELDELLLRDDFQDTIIYAKSLQTSLVNLLNVTGNNLHFSNTEFDRLKFKLKQYKGEDYDEFTKFLSKLEDTTSTSSNSPFQLKINRAIAYKSEFLIINENESLDPNFSIKNLDFNLSNFKLVGPDLNFQMRRMSGILKEGIIVDDFSTKFSYTPQHMDFQKLTLETPYSYIHGDLKFDYEREDLKNFLDQVDIDARFRPSQISSTDLRKYYSGFGYTEEINLEGNATGQINNLTLSSLKVHGLKNTSLKGNLLLVNSFGKSPFKMTGYPIEIVTSYNDLVKLFPTDLKPTLPVYFKEFEATQLKGKVEVSNDVLFTALNISSDLGKANINLNFDKYQDIEKVEYTGFVDVSRFNLSRFFKSKVLGNSSFFLNVTGKGFTKSSLNTLAVGKINSIEINNYAYKNIELNGNLKAPFFDGSLKSLDPNFLFSFEGLIDASQQLNAFDFDADIEYADLSALNIVKNDTLADFKGNLKVDLRGNTIDELEGQLSFNSFTYENSQEIYDFEDLTVKSSFLDAKQTISIESPDVISGTFEGEYKLTSLPKLFSNAIENLYFKNKYDSSDNFQYVDFDLNIYNKIIEVFFPKIEVAPNTFMRGSIDASKNDFSLNFRSPHLEIYGNTFDKINIQIDTDSPLYNSYVEIEKKNNQYKCKYFDMLGIKIDSPEAHPMDFVLDDLGKAGYEHYMLKEISEQPTVIRKIMTES